MNKIISLLMLMLTYLPISYADDWDNGYYQPHEDYDFRQQPQRYYPSQQSYNSDTQPYSPIPKQYYRFNKNKNQSIQGDVLGYEMDNDSPAITGDDSTEDAFFDNDMRDRY